MATSNRPSLTTDLAKRYAASSIPEVTKPGVVPVTIQSNFAKGFLMNQAPMTSDFTFNPSVYVSGLDTTPYTAADVS